MWELDDKKGRAPKNWCFYIVVLKKTLESPLDCRELRQVNSKGNQSWIFTGRTDAKAEAPVLWPPDAKSQLTGKKPWCWERLKAGGEGDDRGQDGWMVSPTRWTWVWASSGRWWRSGKSGTLQSMELQRVRHNWVTEQQQYKQITNKDQLYSTGNYTQYLLIIYSGREYVSIYSIYFNKNKIMVIRYELICAWLLSSDVISPMLHISTVHS